MAARARARGKRTRLLTWLVFPAAVYLLIVLAYWLLQERLIYYPGPPSGEPPPSRALDVRKRSIDTRDGVHLEAWLAIPRQTDASRARNPALRMAAVIVCHGNAGNLAMRMPLAEAFGEMGLATLLFDYRGYGSSPGKTSEEGTYLDAEAAFDRLALEEDVAPDRIAVYGESLGGAVAIELALRRKVAAVVVEDTFTSMPDIAARIYPWLPVRLLLRPRYESAGKVGRIAAPLLVIHSPQDELIPFEHGRKLLEAAREPRRFLATGGRHGEGGFTQRADWRAEVRAFLAETLAEAPAVAPAETPAEKK